MRATALWSYPIEIPSLYPPRKQVQQQNKKLAQFFQRVPAEIGVGPRFADNCRGCSLSVKKLFSHRGASDFSFTAAELAPSIWLLECVEKRRD